MSRSFSSVPYNLYWARLDKGWTQTELSKQAKLSLGTINRIEKGHIIPTPTTLRKIADALGLTPADLIRDFPAGVGQLDRLVKS